MKRRSLFALVLAAACGESPPSDPPSTHGNSPDASGGGGAATTGGTAPALGGAGTSAGSGGLSPGNGGMAAQGGTPSTGGSSGGSAGAGGVAPSNGGSGGTPMGGASGQGATSSGGSGGMATGGEGGMPTSGGSSSGGGGAGGASGMAGMAGNDGGGGVSGMGGAGGMGGNGGSAGADPDRCDIANYDPKNPPEMLPLTGQLGTHDPVLIAAHDRYYLFQTGGNQGLNTKTSSDMLAWQDGPTILAPNPSWIAQHVQGVMNLWAPDISHFNGKYHLYYSASTFGSNHSCIGHATRTALDSGNWEDHGPVICSNEPGPDDWNAIDPNVAFDEDGTPWLSFGSFWGGLKMIRLDQNGARADQMLHSIAARPDAEGALEAPFIVRRCGYYYLFVSFDSCCRGTDSTYKIMVGRSTSITGPYVDKEGTPMMQGGGTLLLAGDRVRYAAVGHNAVVFIDDKAYNVYHAYSQQNGNPILRIAELVWDEEGWPISAGP